MSPLEVLDLLNESVGNEGPVALSLKDLQQLVAADLPEEVRVQVGDYKEGILHLAWDGTFERVGEEIIAEADFTWTRKYWYNPLGLAEYLDLVRRAVERRASLKGDVEVSHFDDDGAYVQMMVSIQCPAKGSLSDVLERATRIRDELTESADRVSARVGRDVADVAATLSGWGSRSLEQLVDTVETALSSDAKGRALEELVSRLFENVPGFQVTGRVRTQTEEIDITVVNGNDDPRLRKEAPLILVECKNWTTKCGKDEFVLFQSKVDNRSGRCSLGFLVSWSGFASTVTREMLRGSREDTLIVPVSGKNLRHAVVESCFLEVLMKCWQDAVMA